MMELSKKPQRVRRQIINMYRHSLQEGHMRPHVLSLISANPVLPSPVFCDRTCESATRGTWRRWLDSPAEETALAPNHGYSIGLLSERSTECSPVRYAIQLPCALMVSSFILVFMLLYRQVVVLCCRPPNLTIRRKSLAAVINHSQEITTPVIAYGSRCR